jgi:hypothetical protein
VHVGVASVAWLAALLAGIASTTVPMFWQTPRPHHWFQKLFPASFWLTSVLLLVPVSQTFAPYEHCRDCLCKLVFAGLVTSETA